MSRAEPPVRRDSKRPQHCSIRFSSCNTVCFAMERTEAASVIESLPAAKSFSLTRQDWKSRWPLAASHSTANVEEALYAVSSNAFFRLGHEKASQSPTIPKS